MDAVRYLRRVFSYGAAGNPEIVLEGKGLNWYTEARFTGTTGGCTVATIGPVSSESGTKLTIAIPLALMQIGCSYTLTLADVCGRVSNQVGQVTIGA